MKSLIVGLFLLAAARPQETPGSSGTLGAPEPSRLERVVVMGASLTSGFGAERSFAAALEAALRAPHEPLVDLGDMLFFTSPLAIGARQLEAAVEAEPTLVVAIDYLFWFGYGTFDAKGGAIENEAERLELLERGLALLTELECPLVLGDFPDMSAAIGKMLAPAQVPAKDTLALLSKRVREWAAAREHVLVLPLSTLVKDLAARKELTLGRHTFPAGSRLLQADDLHPTLEGMAAVAQLVWHELVELELAREGDFDLEFPSVLARLRGKALVPAGAR